MSEADWWLCPNCSSLNNLRARKCYSCRKRKPKNAMRASEVLGYYPVVSWDGKVTLMKPIGAGPEAEAPVAATAAPPSGDRKGTPPPPLREPVRRSIVALAPRYPEPVRVTYADAPPVPLPVPPVSVGPGPMTAPPVPVGPGPFGPPMPRPLAPPPGPLPPPRVPPVPGPVGALGPLPAPTVPPAPLAPPPQPVGHVPPGAPPRPMVPVGPGPSPLPPAPVPAGAVPPALPAEEQWPHWRELLDGPTPRAERLRGVQSEEAALADRLSGSGPVFQPVGSATSGEAAQAIAVDASARGFVPWPEADRLPEPDETSGDPEPLPGEGVDGV